MNEKYYNLPEEKQKRILNAGYRVFSQNSYKKSPMHEIADEAGISKSLLFHYFLNKKELYLFLWKEAAKITIEYLGKYGCHEALGLFEILERGLHAKMQIMRIYPDMAAFVIKAYYEKDPEIHTEIQESYHEKFDKIMIDTVAGLNPDDFLTGLDLELMYKDIYWASEGYAYEVIQQDSIYIERFEQDFTKLIDFWKKIYTKRGSSDGNNQN